MKKKLWRLVFWIGLTIGSGVAVWLCDKYNIGVAEAISGALIAIFLERVYLAIQDIWDTTNWKTSQRKLKRGNFISDSTVIRISFAYLYRIRVGNKYLLVQNTRNTGKYQPVGGVYKLKASEKAKLKNQYHVMDDDKILLDKLSRNDYRLRIENRYLRKFVNRFNSTQSERERIENVGREFKEELVETGILNWHRIQYRFCGRHMTELVFSDHFQVYELLLADIVELIPTSEQEADLRMLIAQDSDKYRFATADQISCLGMDIETGELYEWIADHTRKILQESESQLMKVPETGRVFSVDI